MLTPGDPEYPIVERRIARYDFDLRRAAQMVESLGYTRGADGVFRDAACQRLTLEIRSTTVDVNEKSMLAVANYWQQFGIPTEPIVIPRARANDREWRHQKPAFELQRQPNALADLDRYTSAQVPLPENNFTGTSKHRYMNAELDALIDRYFSTIPRPERVEVVGGILQHISEQAVPLPMFYDANPSLISNRLRNVTARKGGTSTEVWNVEDWDTL
jgi:ABC-type transport system substrate-binding protein